jgi:MYXO-CTERM domain-containing protein
VRQCSAGDAGGVLAAIIVTAAAVIAARRPHALVRAR